MRPKLIYVSDSYHIVNHYCYHSGLENFIDQELVLIMQRFISSATNLTGIGCDFGCSKSCVGLVDVGCGTSEDVGHDINTIFGPGDNTLQNCFHEKLSVGRMRRGE